MNSRPPGRQLAAQRQQPRQVLRQPPHLAPRAVAVAGRIEDHGVVAVAAFQLPLDELHRVLDDPADRGVGQAGKLGVAACPGHDVLGRVDVDHFGPGRGRRQRAPAGVGEQVEDFGSFRSLLCEADKRHRSAIQSQFSACSGNSPTWPKSVRFNSNRSGPWATVHRSGSSRRHGPLPFLFVASLEAGVGLRPQRRDRPARTVPPPGKAGRA